MISASFVSCRGISISVSRGASEARALTGCTGVVPSWQQTDKAGMLSTAMRMIWMPALCRFWTSLTDCEISSHDIGLGTALSSGQHGKAGCGAFCLCFEAAPDLNNTVGHRHSRWNLQSRRAWQPFWVEGKGRDYNGLQ